MSNDELFLILKIFLGLVVIVAGLHFIGVDDELDG